MSKENILAELKEYTILDHMQASQTPRIRALPYLIGPEDIDELNNGTFLQTPQSVKRVVMRTAKSKGLICRSRKRQLVDQRSYCMHVLFTYAGLGYTHIGRLFKKDHATVIYSIRKHQTIGKDFEYIDNIKEISNFLKQYIITEQ